MLQDYRRQTTIKPFAPILKGKIQFITPNKNNRLFVCFYQLDRTSKRWDSEISIRTNLSLLSISNSSKSSEDDAVDDILDDQSSSSRESLQSSIEDRHVQHIHLDPYILEKHLNGISSRTGNLGETDCDSSVKDLFDESKSAYGWYEDEFNPRSIRPPAFSQHMKQMRDARMKLKSTPRRSARIPVRTTKAERLKLARQRSISESNASLPYLTPRNKSRQSKVTPRSPNRQQRMSSASQLLSLQTLKNNGYRHGDSAQSCKDALDTKGPLLLSSILVKQMRQDIKNNRGTSFNAETLIYSRFFQFQPIPNR